MKDFKLIIKTSLISSLIATIITTGVIINVANDRIFSHDFIISILSLLITILIGWQIYQVIDIKSQIQSIRNNTNNTQEETMARAYTSIMNQTSYIVEGRKDNDDCYNAIANGLFACKHYYLAGKKEEGQKLITIIANFKIENCTLNRNQINNLRIILGQLTSFDIDTIPINEWLNNYEEAKKKL